MNGLLITLQLSVSDSLGDVSALSQLLRLLCEQMWIEFWVVQCGEDLYSRRSAGCGLQKRDRHILRSVKKLSSIQRFQLN